MDDGVPLVQELGGFSLESCSGMLHKGIFLADLTYGPSPLHSWLEVAGIEGWVDGH